MSRRPALKYAKIASVGGYTSISGDCLKNMRTCGGIDIHFKTAEVDSNTKLVDLKPLKTISNTASNSLCQI